MVTDIPAMIRRALAGLLLALLWTAAAQAAPAFVQTTSGVDCAHPFSNQIIVTPTVNHLMVVQANAFASSSDPGVDITDTGANTWNLLDSFTDSVNGGKIRWWWAIANGSSSITISVDGSVGQTCVTASYIQYSGVATVSPNDGHVARFQSPGSTATDGDTSTAIVPTVDGDLILGFFNDQIDGSAPAAGTGFTRRDPGNGLFFEEKIQSTAASIAATWTHGTTHDYAAGVAAFKAAAPAGGCRGKLLLGVGKC